MADSADAAARNALILRQNSVSLVGVYVGSASDEGFIELISEVSVSTDLASLSTNSFQGLNAKVNTLINVACVSTFGELCVE